MRALKSPFGFTLIELIVTITLIGIMLVFAIPRFQGTFLTDATRKTANWLVGTIRTLKENSLIEGKAYSLHLNMHTNTIWVTHDTMSEMDSAASEENGYRLPEGIRLMDVEFPGRGKVSVSSTRIRFYPQGYSDKALIHFETDKHGERTFLVEPFLSNVTIYEKYAGFDD